VIETLDIPGLTWRPNGQSVLAGDLLALYRDLDGGFRWLAEQSRALEMDVPPLFPAEIISHLFLSWPLLRVFTRMTPRT
jgi:hypothetical protein